MTSQATFNSEGEIIPPQRPPAPAGAMIVLPGHGEPGADCGQEIPMHCNHCGHRWIGERSCMLRTCPNCWRKWAHKEAFSSGLRLWAGVSMIAPKRTGRRILHCVVSFLPSGNMAEDRKRAIKIMKFHGVSGGLAIFHPFRQDDDGVFIPQSHVHYHIIGLARGAVFPGASGDYFFKVIKDAKHGDYRGFTEITGIKACVFYLLTHCGIVEGRHALTWFGELSYNMLSNQALYDAHPEIKAQIDKVPPKRCPVCGSDDTEPDFIYDWTEQSIVDCRPWAYG